MGRCKICGYESDELANSISICRKCLRRDASLARAVEIHRNWRYEIGLPVSPPKSDEGVKCPICINECIIKDGEVGFCGIITNIRGRIRSLAGRDFSLVHWYLDPLPTNCVADPVCPASTERGYPDFTKVRGAEYGNYNLAVFYGGCNLDCVFCQNIEHKYIVTGFRKGRYAHYKVNFRELLYASIDDKITCICFFGGDPTPNILYSLKLAREIDRFRRVNNVIKRICWETNGLVNPVYMRRMSELSRDSGGIVKIDWKAWSPAIYSVLTGINGYRAVERLKNNVKIVYNIGSERTEPPILVVSILVIPHYIDYDEVYNIALYLSSISDSIPIMLLGFYPHHLMRDVPTTSWSQMNEVVNAVKDAGVKEYYIGNSWLLRNV